jgi:hypothetical protein
MCSEGISQPLESELELDIEDTGTSVSWTQVLQKQNETAPGFAPGWGKKNNLGQALVAQICNPSYSGDRDQGDRGLKPAPGS